MVKVFTKILGEMIWIKMNSKNCVVKHGVKKINYLCIDMTENKIEVNYRIFKDNENTYIECIPESGAF